ncbi:hypothetical protein QFC22_005903 [Naganishia vaughanmartiniae]|uniref:Uncharacterized protein n=1 Tax=Naganishia vaughanmartiniae TaxID=1424756 RepID=A0ACC2WQM2_9TREE|nr:hypothetical protein QFC22_005903 [Naganishia vaughanmartiniae]
MAAKTATTGVDNPLKVFSDSEKKQISIAEDAYNGAVDAFKAAQTRGESKEKVDALRDVAREKEEDLKGLQDLCD